VVGPPPPYDPECGAVLAALPPFPPMTAEGIPAMRVAADRFMPRPTNEDLARGGSYTVEERTVPGPDGAPGVGLIVCRPAAVETPAPALYYTHGGGMIGGTARDALGAVLDLAEPVGAAVVSVEYRLAPETPHPGPVEDCYAGLVWTAEHAADLGIDPAVILIAGASAGGGLAAGTALLARDRQGPALVGQLLICPMLDDRDQTVSTHQVDGVGVWDRGSNLTGWTALLGDRRGTDDVSIYAAPARATDLSGLPPAYIDCGSVEVFRDEDVAYATGLWGSGVQAELHVWAGGFHGFDMMAAHAAVAQAAIAARDSWVDRVLGS
jgi:acetyl esterase/lipase